MLLRFTHLMVWAFALISTSSVWAQPLHDPFADDLNLKSQVSAAAPLPVKDLPSYQEWAKTAPPATLSSLSVSELAQWQIQAPFAYGLLDARSEDEFEHSHIDGARRVGAEDFNVERVWMFPRKQTLIVYCNNGERSKSLGQYLQLMGFEDVRILEGSLIAWAAQGGKLVNQHGKPTREVILTDRNGKKVPKKFK